MAPAYLTLEAPLRPDAVPGWLRELLRRKFDLAPGVEAMPPEGTLDWTAEPLVLRTHGREIMVEIKAFDVTDADG